MVICAGMTVLAAYHGAPWYFYVPVLSAGGLLLYMLIANPVSGLHLHDDVLILSPLLHPRFIPVGDVGSVEIISWSDSTDMVIHLKSGESVAAASGDIPPRAAFRDALARVGIPLEER